MVADNHPGNQINFESFIEFSLKIFRRNLLFDFNKLDVEATFRQKLVYRLRELYVKLCIAVLASIFVQDIAYSLETSTDFLHAAGFLLDALASLTIVIKSVSIFVYKDDIRSIMEELEGMFCRSEGSGLKNHLDTYNRFTKIYLGASFLLSTPIVYRIVPYVLYGEMQMAVRYWFPIDVLQLETFPIYLFASYWISVNWLSYGLAADSLLYAIQTVIIIEFDKLKTDLMNFNNTSRDERKLQMGKIVDRHNKLIELCDKLQNVFSGTFLIDCTARSIILCIIAFNLVASDAELIYYAYCFPYLAVMGWQIFLLCFFGQRLTDASLSVADGVTNCDWQILTESDVTKGFLLILTQSQRGFRLTAMGFADISLVTFTAIMTATSSYFSFMKSIYVLK